MKKVLISVACLLVLAALYACSNTGNEELKTADPGDGKISFERVSPDALSPELAEKIDQSKASEGYEIITAGSESYIVVYAGERPTAGYSIEITSIAAADGQTTVTVKENTPAKGDMVAEVLTYPYDIAKLATVISGSVEIEFEK